MTCFDNGVRAPSLSVRLLVSTGQRTVHRIINKRDRADTLIGIGTAVDCVAIIAHLQI